MKSEEWIKARLSLLVKDHKEHPRNWRLAKINELKRVLK